MIEEQFQQRTGNLETTTEQLKDTRQYIKELQIHPLHRRA